MNTLIDIVKKQFEGINLKEYVELVAYITSPTYFVGKKTFKILEKKGKNRHFATMVGLFGALITAEMSAFMLRQVFQKAYMIRIMLQYMKM